MGDVRWSGEGRGSVLDTSACLCRFLVVLPLLMCHDLDVCAALRDNSFGASVRLCICSSQLLLQECPLLKTSVNFETPPQPHNTCICVVKYCTALLLPEHTVTVDAVGLKGSEASPFITAGRTRRAHLIHCLIRTRTLVPNNLAFFSEIIKKNKWFKHLEFNSLRC